MRFQLIFFVTICIISLAGCSNMDSIYRPFNVNQGTGALIDIKQRAVIVSSRSSNTGSEDKTKTKNIVCAEPSPDSLAAYAAQLAAEVKSNKVNTAFQESASSVGRRTQSIQLMRDALYRLCEGYMNGALDEDEYGLLVRRSQRDMVAFLAIEQLTDSIRSPSVTVSEMKSEIEKIDAEIAAQKQKKKAEGVKDEEKATLDEKIRSQNEYREAILKGIENAGNLAGVDPNSHNVETVTAAVKEIALNLNKIDDAWALCFWYLRDHPDKPQENLLNYCKGVFDKDLIIPLEPVSIPTYYDPTTRSVKIVPQPASTIPSTSPGSSKGK